MLFDCELISFRSSLGMLWNFESRRWSSRKDVALSVSSWDATNSGTLTFMIRAWIISGRMGYIISAELGDGGLWSQIFLNNFLLKSIIIIIINY